MYHLCFLAHYRHFKLHLIPHVELFSENFHAYSVGENNEKIEIAVDKDSFYKGYDEGITLSLPLLLFVILNQTSYWHKSLTFHSGIFSFRNNIVGYQKLDLNKDY